MNKILIITVIAILLIPMLIYLAGKYFVNKKAIEELEELRFATEDLSSKIYNENQLEGLPQPVQRYFKYALKNGQPYISQVYLEHDGLFKTALDKEWINIKGEQYFSAEKPGFIWKGKTDLFTVRDMYISQKGRIKVMLMDFIQIIDGQGFKIDQGELLRWLGESVWFPTNLLPGPRLNWSKIDDETAKLTFNYGEQKLNYKVNFDKSGAIVQLETQRYLDGGNLETWIGRISQYEEVDGMQIPMKIEAIWRLADGEHSYAQFNVTKIQYN